MIGEIVAIGTEILLGDTVNTNGAYLAKELAVLGIQSYHQTIVGDNPARLKEALETALDRSDIVFTIGGLGPTYDDITKDIVAEIFDVPMELDVASEKQLAVYFSGRDIPMSENNLRQAFMPQGGLVLENKLGTANGVIVEKDGKTAVLLPGPPRECRGMFDKSVKNFLMKKTEGTLVSKNLYFLGLGESDLEAQIPLRLKDSSNPTVATYAGNNQLFLRITAQGKTEKDAELLLVPVAEELKNQFSEYYYSDETGNLAQLLVQALEKKGLRIATAESCTGGLVSSKITGVDGSSKVFDLGICTYSNEMKEKYLGVSKEILESKGAVSEETALAMAQGIRKVSGADYGISTTGIAGPTGGTKHKPVGLVYIGISGPQGDQTYKLNLGNNRDDARKWIRIRATNILLFHTLKTIDE